MGDFQDFVTDFEIVNAEDIQALAKEVQEKGVSVIPEKVRQGLDKWKDVPLNIAVTGASGVGKSSFINAIRRMDAGSDGAAAVGVTETTAEPTPYAHPDNEKVLFWDLPGVGTPRFTRDKYMDAVEFSRFDFFVIICCNRFCENDLWLANQIKAQNKRFYFARSQTDQAVKNDRRDHPKTHSECALLEKMKSDCATQLEQDGFFNTPIFLISSRKPLLWDFPKLMETFITDIPSLKKEVMLYSIKINTEAIIKEKSKMLLARVWKVATASAAVAFVPVPGLSFAVDAALIVNEISFYKKTYGLDDENLDELSKASGVGRESFDLRLKAFSWMTCTAESVGRLLAPYAAEYAAEEVIRFIPFVGALVAGPLSFASTMLTLRAIIQEMEKNAIEIIGMTITRASGV